MSIAFKDFISAYIIILNLAILLNGSIELENIMEGRCEAMRKVWALFGLIIINDFITRTQALIILTRTTGHRPYSHRASFSSKDRSPPEAACHPVSNPGSVLSVSKREEQRCNSPLIQQIKDMVKYSEQKIQLIFSEEPNTYLQHLSSKNDNNDTQVLLKEIIGLENDLFVDRIASGGQRVYERPNFKDLNSSLTNKITDMKRSIMSLSSIDRKASKEF